MELYTAIKGDLLWLLWNVGPWVAAFCAIPFVICLGIIVTAGISMIRDKIWANRTFRRVQKRRGRW